MPGQDEVALGDVEEEDVAGLGVAHQGDGDEADGGHGDGRVRTGRGRQGIAAPLAHPVDLDLDAGPLTGLGRSSPCPGGSGSSQSRSSRGRPWSRCRGAGALTPAVDPLMKSSGASGVVGDGRDAAKSSELGHTSNILRRGVSRLGARGTLCQGNHLLDRLREFSVPQATSDPPWLSLPTEISEVLRPVVGEIVEAIIEGFRDVPVYAMPMEGRFGQGVRQGSGHRRCTGSSTCRGRGCRRCPRTASGSTRISAAARSAPVAASSRSCRPTATALA